MSTWRVSGPIGSSNRRIERCERKCQRIALQRGRDDKFSCAVDGPPPLLAIPNPAHHPPMSDTLTSLARCFLEWSNQSGLYIFWPRRGTGDGRPASRPRTVRLNAYAIETGEDCH